MQLQQKVTKLLNEKNMKELKEVLNQQQVFDLIELFQEMYNQNEREEIAISFRLLSKDISIDVFEQLDVDLQQKLVHYFTDQKANEIITGLAPDDRARLLDELPAKIAKKLLNSLSKEKREVTADLLGYAPETAGRIMTPKYVKLKESISVSEALDKIRNLKTDVETVYTLYVTDENRKLIGVLSLRELVMASPEKKHKRGNEQQYC